MTDALERGSCNAQDALPSVLYGRRKLMNVRGERISLMLRCTSCQCHRNMRHRRICRSPMPVFFAGFDMHDIADGNVTLLLFGRDLSFPCSDYENLIAIMHMPAGGRPNSEIDDVAAEIIRLPIADKRLPRPTHLTTGPSRDGCRRVHRFFFKLTYFKYAHFASNVSILRQPNLVAYGIRPSRFRHKYTPDGKSVNRPMERHANNIGLSVSAMQSFAVLAAAAVMRAPARMDYEWRGVRTR